MNGISKTNEDEVKRRGEDEVQERLEILRLGDGEEKKKF